MANLPIGHKTLQYVKKCQKSIKLTIFYWLNMFCDSKVEISHLNSFWSRNFYFSTSPSLRTQCAWQPVVNKTHNFHQICACFIFKILKEFLGLQVRVHWLLPLKPPHYNREVLRTFVLFTKKHKLLIILIRANMTNTACAFDIRLYWALKMLIFWLPGLE